MENLNSADDLKEFIGNKPDDDELFYSLSDLKEMYSLPKTSGTSMKCTSTNRLGTNAYENCVSKIVLSNDSKNTDKSNAIKVSGDSIRTLSSPFSLNPLLSVNTHGTSPETCQHMCVVTSSDSDEDQYSLADLAKKHETAIKTTHKNPYGIFLYNRSNADELNHDTSEQIQQSFEELTVEGKDSSKSEYNIHSDRKVKNEIAQLCTSSGGFYNLNKALNNSVLFNEHTKLESDHSVSDSDDELSYSLADLAKQHLSSENLEKDVLCTADQGFGGSGAENFSSRDLGCNSSSCVERVMTCLPVKSEKFLYLQPSETSNMSSASDLASDKNGQEYFVTHSHSLPNLPSGHAFRNVDKELEVLCSSYDRAKSRFKYNVSGRVRKDTPNSLSKSDISATESSRNCSESSDLLLDEMDGLWFSEMYPSSLSTQKAMAVQNESTVSDKQGTDSSVDWEIDLSSALKSVDLNPPNLYEVVDSVEGDIDNWTLPLLVQTLSPKQKPVEECVLDSSVSLKMHLVLRTKCSSFGKVICKKWKVRRKPYIKIKTLQTSIKRFRFDTLSPDDKVLELRQK